MYMPDLILLLVGHYIVEKQRHKPTSSMDIVGKINEIYKRMCSKAH